MLTPPAMENVNSEKPWYRRGDDACPSDKKIEFPVGRVLEMAGVGLHWRQRLRETFASIHIETSQETSTNLRNTFQHLF